MKSVILTNERGESLGTAEIMDAHTDGGKLHKAFSIFILTPDGAKVLLQRRASTKLLFPGFWANTCCSHPKEKFPIEVEANDRLMEECGFRTALDVVDSFVYKANDPEGRGTEYEYDTILQGFAEESVELKPNPDEVMDMKWMTIEDLQNDMKANSDTYAPWLHDALPILLDAR